MPATSTPAAGFATRIRIPSLSIDLPVVAGDLVIPGADPLYPLCDVALYHSEFVQPGQEGTTYLYAHAQRGMFAPLLKASEVDDGAQLVGSLVEIYTSDDRLHLYEIALVKRHAVDLTITEIPAGTQQLVLQTSEGVSGTIEKLQVAARPLSVQAAFHAVANPMPSPRVCGP